MDGQKKPFPIPGLIKIKWPKTITGLIRSFTVKENHIGSAISEILRYRQKMLTTLYNRILTRKICGQLGCQYEPHLLISLFISKRKGDRDGINRKYYC